MSENTKSSKLERAKVPHGRSRYCYGCRCDICKKADKKYRDEYRKMMKERNKRYELPRCQEKP